VTAGSSAAAGGAGDAAGDSAATLPDDASEEHAALDLAGVALEKPASDGRVARGQRTRHNVGEALMELLRAGDLDPTAKEVAMRAGVSLRLVFHHFADMDDLYEFVGTLQLRRQWADMPQLSPKLALSTRIERTVAHRAAFFEEIAQVRHALARRSFSSAGVRQVVRAADSLFFEDLKATFAPELAELPGVARAEYLGALDTCTSWDAWERLRTTSGAEVRSARRVMSLMVAALFTGSDVDGRRGAAVSTGPSVY
jgi:TetR/AcrR family transcriptional regulator, regulator of autoinduction and epiphytic fitness